MSKASSISMGTSAAAAAVLLLKFKVTALFSEVCYSDMYKNQT